MQTNVDFRAIGKIVAECPAVSCAWVFGSVARGDASCRSDLDVAVLLGQPPTREDVDALRAMAAALEPYAPSRRVDVVMLGPQGPIFRHRLLREGRLVLDRDPTRRIDFEARTISEYLDWKPTHDIAMASTLEGLRARFARGAR